MHVVHALEMHMLIQSFQGPRNLICGSLPYFYLVLSCCFVVYVASKNPMQMDNIGTNCHALNSTSLKEQVKPHALNEDDYCILGGGSTTKVCPIELLTNNPINPFDNLVDQ
jgi:hypothetical protein